MISERFVYETPAWIGFARYGRRRSLEPTAPFVVGRATVVDADGDHGMRLTYLSNAARVLGRFLSRREQPRRGTVPTDQVVVLGFRSRMQEGDPMPFHFRIDRGFTIAASSTQFWNWNWFGDTGPNKGPVIFRALPKGPAQGGNNTARNVLVTYDFAECRGGPGDPSAPEVFYEFKIRNESSVTVPFDLEIVHFSDLPIIQG